MYRGNILSQYQELGEEEGLSIYLLLSDGYMVGVDEG